MRRIFSTACAALLAFAALSACSNDPTVNPNGTQTNGSNLIFRQVDRIGKPGIKMLYISYANHVAYNSAIPAGDTTGYGPTIAAFIAASPAGRSAAISSYVTAVMTPDALIANVDDTSTRASYLGWETSGQLQVDCTGLPATTFGGRALNDDVVNAILGLTFGNSGTSTTLTAPTPNVATSTGSLSPPADDGAEKNGTNGSPNLTNQQVACPNRGFTLQQFPYLGPPV
jgi:hypothetical protein